MAENIEEEILLQPMVESLSYSDNDYCSALLEKLKQQREAGKFCDVVLHVQGKLFHAHRSVLAVSSPYFDSVLKKHKAVREQLTFACDNHDVFRTLLDYMYNGQVIINFENVDELLRLAKQLSLEKLKVYCEDFLHNFMSVDTCFKVKDLAEKHSAEPLLTNVINFILKYFTDILRSEEILKFDIKSFEAFLTDKRFGIGDCALKLISKWILKDKTEREGNLKKFLQVINFEQLDPTVVWDYFREDELYLTDEKSTLLFLEILVEKNFPFFDEFRPKLDELKVKYGNIPETTEPPVNPPVTVTVAQNEALSELSDAPPADDFDDSGSNEENIEKPPLEVKVPPLKLTKLLAHRAKTAAKLGKGGRSPKTPTGRTTTPRSVTRALKASQLKTVPPKPSLEERKRKAAAVAAALAVETNWSDSDTSIEIQPVARTRTRKGNPVKRVARKASDSGISKKSNESHALKTNNENSHKLLENGNSGDSSTEGKEEIPTVDETSKRKRKVGRPQKLVAPPYIITVNPGGTAPETRRKRGRPRKCLRLESQDEIPSDILAFAENSDGGTDEENNEETDEDNNDEDYNLDFLNEPPITKGPKKPRKPRNHGLTRPYKGRGKCPHCSYVEHSAIRLERHVARVHSKEITYKCSLCDYTCNWNREFYIHMKVHFQGPPYTCESCSYTCDRVQLLLKHRMRHTDERPFKCDQCKYTSRTEWNLRIHMRCHTGEKPYQCDLCGRRFSMKAGLDQHVQSHRKDRPFLCDTCGFATKYKSYLVSHMRIHAGTAFRCDYPNCEYFTPKRSQLKAHMRTHKAIRAHICAICGRGFVERSHLVRHERIHLNEKPFKCDSCDYTSSRRDKLKEHIDKHHNANAEAATKTPYKPRKPRRPKPDPSMFPRPDYPTHSETAQVQLQQQHQQQHEQQQQQHHEQQQQAQTHPTEAILIHAAHQAEFQTPTLIYHTQEHLGAHHHHDHTGMVYQNHKHHNPHHHTMEAVQIDQRLVPTTQMVHHENHQQCPQQHPDLSGLHVGAFMAVY